MNCIIKNSSKNTSYNLAYIIENIDWEAEYSLYLTSDKIGEIEGWYAIRNDNNITYENTDIFLVSGAVNFESHKWNPEFTKYRATTNMTRIGKNQSMQPETGETEEYFLFHLPHLCY